MKSPVGKAFQLRSSGGGRSQAELIRAARSALVDGNIWQADQYAKQASAMDSQNIEMVSLMGTMAGKTGRALVGIQMLEGVLTRNPRHQDSLRSLGQLFRMVGRQEEAIGLLQQAIQLRSSDAEAFSELGLCYLDLGRPEEASGFLERAVALSPKTAIYHHNLGNALEKRGALVDAIRCFKASITLDPSKPMSYGALGQIMLTMSETEAAARCFRDVYRLDPHSPQSNALMAQTLIEEGSYEEAITLIEKAVANDPRASHFHSLLGSALQKLGKFDEAAVHLHKAIELEPDRAGAYQLLLSGKKVTAEDLPLVEHALEVLETGAFSESDEITFHYAIGKAKSDYGEYEQAMIHYDHANRISFERMKKAGTAMDRTTMDRMVDEIKSVYTPDLLSRASEIGDPSDVPVFIVGMIRSGTTLTEQIVSSHPKVAGAGELMFWRNVFRETIGSYQAPIARIPEISRDFLAVLRGVSSDAARVTDKMPANFLALGLIHLAFPNARIIHCRRDAVDTCLSIYMTPFRSAPEFGHDRENMVFYYHKYLEVMEHWRAVLSPDRFMETDYETLVADGEPTIRRMIDFLGLEWDDACLSHESNDRAIATPSQWQARQPLYTSSTQKWRKYEPWLGAFEQLLPDPR